MSTRFGMQVARCLFILTLVGFMAACSGGGGGGGGGDQRIDLPYTGARSQAIITEENAEYLAVNAFQLSWGMNCQYLFGAGASAGRESTIEGEPQPKALLGLDKISRTIRNHFTDQASQARAKIEDTWTEYGNCGGEIAYSLTFDDVTGKFSGDIEYRSYCEDGIIYNGRIRIGGQLDQYWQDYESYKITFENVTITEDEQDSIIQGIIDLESEYDSSVSGTRVTITTNLLFEDHGTGIAYFVDGFKFRYYDFGDDSDMRFTGRYYESDLGYVDVSDSDEVTFIISYAGSVFRGVLQLEGANNTKAQLRFSQHHIYRVIADTDGDGTYDWDSGVLEWE